LICAGPAGSPGILLQFRWKENKIKYFTGGFSMDGTITITTKKTAAGELLLGSYNDRLCLCDWNSER